VSFLTEYEITAEPVRTGRSVTHVKFSWQKKRDIGAQIAAVEEWERSTTGRKSRMHQTRHWFRVMSCAHEQYVWTLRL
jgi:plasmid replication initiation protein